MGRCPGGSHKPALTRSTLVSAPMLASIIRVVVLYTDLTFQLPPTLTFSCHRHSNGYEVCGLAAKDHLKINEGEVKGHQLVLLM